MEVFNVFLDCLCICCVRLFFFTGVSLLSFRVSLLNQNMVLRSVWSVSYLLCISTLASHTKKMKRIAFSDMITHLLLLTAGCAQCQQRHCQHLFERTLSLIATYKRRHLPLGITSVAAAQRTFHSVLYCLPWWDYLRVVTGITCSWK